MATDFNNIYSSLINLKKNLSLTYIIFKVESNLGHHPSRQFSHCMHQSPQWSIEVPGVYYMAYLLMTYRTGRGSGLSSYASIIKVSLLFPSWTYIAFHCKKCFHWSRKLFKKKIPSCGKCSHTQPILHVFSYISQVSTFLCF